MSSRHSNGSVKLDMPRMRLVHVIMCDKVNVFWPTRPLKKCATRTYIQMGQWDSLIFLSIRPFSHAATHTHASRHTYGCVTSHIQNKSHHTNKLVNPASFLVDWTLKPCRHIYPWVTSHIRTSHVYPWVTSHIRTSHVTHTHESRHTNKWVTPCKSACRSDSSDISPHMCLVTHTDESRHTKNEYRDILRVLFSIGLLRHTAIIPIPPYILMRHGTRQTSNVSRTNESCHTNKGVTWHLASLLVDQTLKRIKGTLLHTRVDVEHACVAGADDRGEVQNLCNMTHSYVTWLWYVCILSMSVRKSWICGIMCDMIVVCMYMYPESVGHDSFTYAMIVVCMHCIANHRGGQNPWDMTHSYVKWLWHVCILLTSVGKSSISGTWLIHNWQDCTMYIADKHT